MVDENMMTCDSPNMDLRWPARAAWYRSANCVEPRVQPGGWSTFGQPVDSLHAEFRSEIRRRDLSSTGHVAIRLRFIMFSFYNTEPQIQYSRCSNVRCCFAYSSCFVSKHARET